MILTVDNEDSVEIALPDEIKKMVNFKTEITGKVFDFSIKENYPGEKYDDLCITEISLSNDEFPGNLLYNAYCFNLFKNFKEIQFVTDKNHRITLFPDNTLTVFGSPAQMDVSNEGSGNWKIDNDDAKIEGDYELVIVQNGNDDLTSNESRLSRYVFKETFSLSLSSDQDCTKLDYGKNLIIVNDKMDERYRFDEEEIQILR